MSVRWSPELGWADGAPTLEEVRDVSAEVATHRAGYTVRMVTRDTVVRSCYSAGNATLGQLAQATGLSTQRVHQIVREES